MKKTRAVLALAMTILLAAGCGEGPKEAPDPRAAAMVIDWADLLPQGEEQRLDRLYTDYYADLEARMLRSQRPLSAAAGVEGIEEGSPLDEMPQLGTFNAVAGLDGQRVRLPGFVVPLDTSGRGTIETFLLVPYFGACIHTPPPPPNQVVHVTGTTPITPDDVWMPFWAEGVLHVGAMSSDLGDAAYSLVLEDLSPYDE